MCVQALLLPSYSLQSLSLTSARAPSCEQRNRENNDHSHKPWYCWPCSEHLFILISYRSACEKSKKDPESSVTCSWVKVQPRIKTGWLSLAAFLLVYTSPFLHSMSSPMSHTQDRHTDSVICRLFKVLPKYHLVWQAFESQEFLIKLAWYKGIAICAYTGLIKVRSPSRLLPMPESVGTPPLIPRTPASRYVISQTQNKSVLSGHSLMCFSP